MLFSGRSAAWGTGSAITRVEMKNGLTIIAKDIKSSPLVSINIYVRAGSRDETGQTRGITHFCEHLFFRGTRSATGTEFKSSLEALGGMCNAETTKDYTRYFLNIPAEHAMKGLRLMIDALQDASFNQEEIEQERKVILEEYKLTTENVMNMIADKTYEMAFLGHPYKNPIIGTESNLKNFTREDFVHFRNRFYTPEKLIFVVVGNFDRERTIQYIMEAFRSLPASGKSNDVIPEEGKQTETREKTLARGLDETLLIMSYPGPSVRDRKYIYATDVLCFMLGMGNSSIFNKELVLRKNIFKDISVSYLTQKDPGLIIIHSALKGNDADAAIKEVLATLKKVIAGEFDDEEITRAKKLLINSYIFGSETNAGEASNLGFYEAIDTCEFALSYVQNIKKVKKEDLIETAQKYLSGPHCCLIVKPDPKRKMMEEDEEE